MSLRYLLFLAVFIAAATSFADKKGRKKGDTIDPNYALPMPDQLPAAPLSDRPLPRVTEMRAQVHHTVSQQQGIDVCHYQG